MKTDNELLVDTVADEIYVRLGKASIFSLPWNSRIVAIILGAQGIIDNGGFVYFFENDWTDNPPYTVFANAFREIGADVCAEHLEVAVSLFPFPDPHLDGNARRSHLKKHCMINGRTNNTAALVKLGDLVIGHSETNHTLLAQYIRHNLHIIRSSYKSF